MTTSMSDSEKNGVKGSAPVMPCQAAEEGGSSGQLARGSTPSTPSARRSTQRRMSEQMFFRCTPEECAIIKARAADANLEPSSYLRIQALGQSKARKARHIRADWDELRRCMGVINKAGNVVNQLVLLIRRIGGNPATANAALIELCKAARVIMAAISRG